MVVKTKEFAIQFMKDLKYISLDLAAYKKRLGVALSKHQYNPEKGNQFLGSLKFVGSYSHKKWGDTITDVDLLQSVNVDEELIKKIRNVFIKISKPDSPFKFIDLYCGLSSVGKPPWNVSDCKFSREEVRTWYKNVKDFLPESIQLVIYDIVHKETLSLRDLVDAENLLYKYTNLSWSVEDLINGYTTEGDRKILLLDAIKTSSTIFSFLYRTEINGERDYINVDMSVVDFNTRKSSEDRGSIYLTHLKYYIAEDYLGMFKTLKHMVKDDEKYSEFADKYIRKYSVQSERYGFLDTIKKLKLLSTEEIDRLTEELGNVNSNIFKEEIQKNIKQRFPILLTMVKPEYLDLVNAFLVIAKEGQKSVVVESDVDCPFLPMSIQDIFKLSTHCKNLLLTFSRVYYCIRDVSTTYGHDPRKTVKKFLKGFGMKIDRSNDMYILTRGDEILDSDNLPTRLQIKALTASV